MWWLYIIIVILVLLSGLLGGLVLGLLSLDITTLSTLSTSGNPHQKAAANRILPVRRKSHLLLVTLVLANTAINEALPIVLSYLFGQGWVVIIVATALVFIFAELLPQAICSRFALQVGSVFMWLVYIFIVLLYPLAWPISKLLDLIIPPSTTPLYKRTQLTAFMDLHRTELGGDLTQDEITILQGTLTLHQKKIEQVMTKLSDVFMLPINTLVDAKVIETIHETGHSRIPIYDTTKENIVGALLTKNLIILNVSPTPPQVKDLVLFKLPFISLGASLFDAINLFQGGASHMAIVVSSNTTPIGIVTLEDCIEEVLQEEIIDETDVYVDNTHKRKVVRREKSERLKFIFNNSL